MVVGPTDIVLDLDVVTTFAKIGHLMESKEKKRAPKTQSKMPLLNIQLQDTVFFYPVEKYERLGSGSLFIRLDEENYLTCLMVRKSL